MKGNIMNTIPSKNEIFEEYNNLKSIDEKIEYVKSLKYVDIYNTIKINYDNIINRLSAEKQSQEDQGVWSEFAEEGLLQ
tara:strand:- start:375 stop:611 length:237 start_codon:yes stop_codon:yes gene_type:complete